MSEVIQEVLSKLKTFESQPFLFVGSGLSRRYLNLEDWENFLKVFANKARKQDYSFEQYRSECGDGKPDNVLYPEIASRIERDFNTVWYSEDEYKKSRESNSVFISKGISPFKIEIAEYVKNAKIQLKSKELQDELAIFRQLQQRSVAGVITTNYDTLLQQVFNFEKYVGQEELLFSAPQSIAEIYKIHGCCEKPDSIVITSSDYDKFNERNAYLAAKLLTIFLEHPIIFLGYSVSDANIESILKAIVNCLSQEKLETLKDRLYFVEWNNTDKPDEVTTYAKAFEGGKSLNMTRVFLKDYSKLYYTLLQNKGKYDPRVLRKLKQDVYDLVLTQEAKGSIHVANIDDDTKLSEVEVVIGVGVSKDIAERGLISPEASDLYRDIIFDDGDFKGNIPVLVEELLPKLMKQHSNSLPLWKYVSQYKGETPVPLVGYLHESLDSFLPNSSIKRRDSGQFQESSIAEILENYDQEQSLSQIYCLKEEQLKEEELFEFVKGFLKAKPDYLNDNTKPKRTDLKRLIKILDWMKYRKKG